MTSCFPYSLAENGTLSVFVAGVNHHVQPEHKNYDKIKEGLATLDVDAMVNLIKEKEKVLVDAMSKDKNGELAIDHGIVTYCDEQLHGIEIDRLLEFIDEELPVEGMKNFIKRLQANPSFNSRTQLYKFLEHKFLPITPDGFILAYKGVRNDYMDVRTGKFDNSVGKVNEMPRSMVDDNPDNHCSSGLHAGTIEYAASWGARVVVVKIDPADCVSVPNDCECQKLRCCKYEVVQDYTANFEKPLAVHDGTRYNDVCDDDYDDEDDWEDDEDQDEIDEYGYEKGGW